MPVRDLRGCAGAVWRWAKAAARTAAVLLLVLAAGVAEAAAGTPPPIRSGQGNLVPDCVTPKRLMAFLTTRNGGLDARYQAIAELYRQHGEAWRVRWDYAFFQMVLETRFLTYTGDVKPHQNNFAGLGATGGGVRGDSYPDVSTGVLAHIQHLVVYSGERIANPAGLRTRLKQDDILAVSQKLKRAVTFTDLTNRWAADRAYSRSLEWVADRFRGAHCTEANRPASKSVRAARGWDAPIIAPTPVLVQWRPKPALVAAVVAGLGSGAAAAPAPSVGGSDSPAAAVPATAPACKVLTAGAASGTKTLLIRSNTSGELRFTALQVLDGFEGSMSENFIKTHASGGETIATFASKEAALARARELCGEAGGVGRE